MPDQKKSNYLQNTSSTNHTINNEESRKIVDELKPEDKISVDSKSKQDERTDSKESGKIDDTEPKPDGKVTSDKISKEEDGIDNKESGKIDDTEPKPDGKVTSDKISKQEDGIDNNESGKIVDTEPKPEEKVTSEKISKQEDGIDNKESGKIDDTEPKPDGKVTSDKISKEEDGIDNKESGKIDDTEPKPNGKVTSDKISKQEDGIDNNESGKIDDTEPKPEEKVTSEKISKQEDGIDNKESGKIDDTEPKPDGKVTSDKISKEEDGIDNKESGKIDDTEPKPNGKVTSEKISKQEDGIDNNESGKIDDSEPKPEEKVTSEKISKEEEGINNKESGKIDDTEPKPEKKVTSDKISKEEDGIDNNESGKIDDTEPKPEEKVTSDKISKEEDGINNKESGKIDDTEPKPEEKVTSDKISKEEDGINNKESGKIDDTEQNIEGKVTLDKTTVEEGGIDNIESGKINGEPKPEDKICIDNKSRIEDGPPLALKIYNAINVNNESGEYNATLSIKNEMWIDNEEFGGRNNEMLFEDETCINNKANSEDGHLPPTIDENNTGEMWPCNSRTLVKTVNSRKRYQNQNDGLYDNEQYVLKKIKVEDTSDDHFHDLWEYLQYDLTNFNQWVNILHMVDAQNIEVNARMAYSKFLELYPLCYGYWKKYANFEKRNNNIDEFEKVLENALSAIPISVDLWICYMTYLTTERYDDEYHIRNEFERSLRMCGLDYRSDQLWHDYISWEVERNEIFNAANIYYRLIRTPTSNYTKNFFKFQEFIFQTLPEKYLGLSEFLKKRNMIIQSLEINFNRESSNYDSIPPGEDFQQETKITEDNILSILRVEIIDEWYNVHKQTAIEFESRKIFEENIQRPHFHVNELESAQIINWENYIKFEKRAGNQERIIFLYERCLIPCVLNERFWLNYLEYLSFVDFDVTVLLSDVFKRSLFHHPKSLQLNLKYFDFSETQGWEETAVETITQLKIIYPDSREVAVKLINLARKKQDGTLGILYQHHLNCSQSKSFSSYIAVKYARFVWKHDRQLNIALDILCNTITNNGISVNDSLEIYLTLVELKMEINPKDQLSILKTIDDIILQCNLYKEKLVFSKKKIEYVEDYIQDYDMLRLAKIEYKNLKNACFIEKKQLLNSTM